MNDWHPCESHMRIELGYRLEQLALSALAATFEWHLRPSIAFR